MRINNPRLFNGDLLATKKQITTWLQGTASENFTGKVAASVIPISGITIESTEVEGFTSGVLPIYGTTITLDPSAQTPQTIAQKFTEIEGKINAVKKYEVEAFANNAVSAYTTSSEVNGIVTDKFNVGLILDGDSLTQTSSGLKVTDDFVEGIASGIAQEIQVVKLGTATTGYASSYEVQFNGVTLGQTIDIPKDKFVKSAEFIESLTAAEAAAAGQGFAEGDPAIKFTIYTSADGTEAATESVFYVNVKKLVDTYTAGDGLQLVSGEFSGVVDPTSDSYFTVGANGFKLSGVSAAIEDIKANNNKFIAVTTDFPASGETDKEALYYNEAGKAMIWNDNAWQSVSMEAVTSLNGTVSDETIATSKAIKEYVTGYVATEVVPELTGLREDLNTVSGDLDDLEDIVSGINDTLPKKAEIFTVSRTFGGATTASVPGRVIAVYDSTNAQCYPEINYASNASTLSASDLESTEIFTVVYVTATEQAGPAQA